ncbi:MULTISPECIES: bifunctional glutamate N-acetyltransferase/amino-acid acetyltransferase ArgJ [unclassified Crossiella]|uniref:bifunctional glutamate N-acetyltransferase/amino-acid acetyltransferase ArgJ n=1 Tax=unclassified Crossiella TaxID=2620835 RepID=UPI001FFEED25|nr:MULTISPECIES: bifunctional glutamate N-acetyltransferase/amino-acid acetyltransferase ArgJ [unclassified Crossiella]MCK2240733.1 bifunctional glutamate N-acetyltransferase/amino-acid acetyltransferase ArgJ [Crossiella sp. S99.2]MCK2252816.1 bifunctional glutamate N-acetyltransferase/amino-acid acetyltransferase ArgJ [Crossiella sp. S99.1]
MTSSEDLVPDISAGVTTPAGFRAAGLHVGVKASGNPDLTLVVNDGPADVAAGVFTTNQVKAAPVLWSQEVLKQRRLRAVVLNSGGANACTGPEGFQDSHATAEKVAAVLGAGAVEIGVCSTGLIGERLPMDKIIPGVDAVHAALGRGAEASLAAATAVMTTDSKPKQAALTHADGWSVGGFAKGAGMCAPTMATMLAVMTTDAVVDADSLDKALRAAVDVTFNSLDVDGGTSTNDTLLLLSSGASGSTPDPAEFVAVLTAVARSLTRQLQRDAEGATKYVEVTVVGAVDDEQAKQTARVVAEDNLVKTALFGSDPNWGRIAMAVGRSGITMDQSKMDITVNGITVCRNGMRGDDRSLADLSGTDIDVHISLGMGAGRSTVYTTDLSHDYVEENSAYSS